MKADMKDPADTVIINTLITRLSTSVAGDSLAVQPDEKDLEIDFFGSPEDTISSQGWFERLINERLAHKRQEVEQKYEGDYAKASLDVIEKLIHALPQFFFLSLPFFAFFLQLLYWRSLLRRYVEHFIFSIYHYAFLYVVFVVMLVVSWSLDQIGWEIPENINPYMVLAMVLFPFVYLYLSMRRFYADKGWKLLIRYLVLLFLFLICLILLSFIVALITVLF